MIVGEPRDASVTPATGPRKRASDRTRKSHAACRHAVVDGDARTAIPMMVPDAIKLRLDALHHRPVFMAAMSHVHTIVMPRIAAPCAQAVAIATIITTTGTIGAGVRTRVQD